MEQQEERRRDGWTLWKEVYGTFLATIPALVMAIGFAASLWSVQREHALQIRYLQEADARYERERERDRGEVLIRLDRINATGETLQQNVARVSAQVEVLQQQVVRRAELMNNNHKAGAR